MIRVLHFYKTASPDTVGGVEKVIQQLASNGKDFGIDTDVLSLTSKKVSRITQMDSYLSHRARLDLQIFSTGFSFSVIWRFRSLAKAADIIHYHFPWPFMDVVHFLCRGRFKFEAQRARVIDETPLRVF